MKFYVLDGQTPRAVDSVEEWGRWYQTGDRVVAQTTFHPNVLVSTVFLGLDHRFLSKGPPILFETMVFGINAEDEAMTRRYSSWDDAEVGHKATVRRVKDLLVKASVEAKKATEAC